VKKTAFTFLGLCLTLLTFGQTNNNEKLIELGKNYKDFMFRNEPTKDVFKDMKANVPENLKTATDFILQTIVGQEDNLNQ